MAFLKMQRTLGVFKNVTYAWRFQKRYMNACRFKKHNVRMEFLKMLRPHGIYKNAMR
jgi:hypothetical protein